MFPLKFRAWAVEDDEMHYDVQNGLKAIGMSGTATFGEIVADTADFRVMQSTGLHDKNGVEIYEGDILRVVHSWNNGEPEQFANATVVFEQYADGEQYGDTHHLGWIARYSLEGYSNRTTLPDCREYGEVIGNICQNPDLLLR